MISPHVIDEGQPIPLEGEGLTEWLMFRRHLTFQDWDEPYEALGYLSHRTPVAVAAIAARRHWTERANAAPPR
ncbi:hypothetical protein AB0M38_31550 [Streptomyces sp. NPDC051742]|uniref:hypothetical protein n=1 Tax=unclassified Streptomyces TaxID=2593676 RepID=UPI00341FF2A8